MEVFFFNRFGAEYQRFVDGSIARARLTPGESRDSLNVQDAWDGIAAAHRWLLMGDAADLSRGGLISDPARFQAAGRVGAESEEARAHSADWSG